jgi:glycosyltransferase involved in cell wall biosynthesis
MQQHRPWRRHRYDVVFYTPWVGSSLASGRGVPHGGAETQVLMLSQALVRRGLRVAIISYENPGVVPAQVNGVTVITRPGYKKPRGFLGRIIEIGHIWRALWRAPSPTIVYRTANYELGLIALYARVAGRKLVFSSANIVDFAYHKHETGSLRVATYKLGVRLADTIVVQTEEQVELCRATFGREAALVKSIAPVAEAEDDAPVAFLWVGRLVSWKRPLEYVALAEALPEAKFWMVGVPSPTTGRTDQLLAEEVSLRSEAVPNLELLSPRPHGEIGNLLGRAVASVNTADFEGMPNVLLEAWSRGVPALVLHHDPSSVVETHGLGGFASGSREKLVELAREQWIGRNDRKELSQRCRRYIQTNHSPELVAEAWDTVVARGDPRDVDRVAVAAEDICAA